MCLPVELWRRRLITLRLEVTNKGPVLKGRTQVVHVAERVFVGEQTETTFKQRTNRTQTSFVLFSHLCPTNMRRIETKPQKNNNVQTSRGSRRKQRDHLVLVI